MVRALTTALLALLICGCGGGGGGGGETANRAPIANAGPARSGEVGQLITLDGSGSSDPDGQALTYTWSILSRPAGSTSVLAGASSVAPSFRPDVPGAYTLGLSVGDGVQFSAPATVSVTVVLNSADQAAQTNALLSATIDVAASDLRLGWSDTFPSGATYRVERRNGEGSFVLLETVTGGGGASSRMDWQRTYTGPIEFRLTAEFGNKELPVKTADGQSTLKVDIPEVNIVFGSAEPVTAPISLSLLPAIPGSHVNWLIDGKAFAAGTTATWDPATVASGGHVITARLALNASVAADLRRSTVASNTVPAMNLDYTDSGDIQHVDVRASSPSGITRIDMSMDGGAVSSVTASNACITDIGPACTPIYRFSFNTAALGPGEHNAVVTARDGVGGTITEEIAFSISAAPRLTVLPAPGTFVRGQLPLQGSFTTRTGQPATVTAWLGATQVFQTTAQTFSQNIDLAGIESGNHTLTVRATDAGGASTVIQRRIVVASSAANNYAPLFAVDERAVIHTSGPEHLVLYSLPGGAVRLRNLLTSAEIALQDTAGVQPQWTMTRDWIYSVGQPANCPRTSCLLRWSKTDGSMTNMTILDPAFAATPEIDAQRPQATEGFVLWLNRANNSFTLYRDSPATFETINTPTPGAGEGSLLDVSDFSFGHDNVVPYLFYFLTRRNPGSGPQTHYLYRWSPDKGHQQWNSSQRPTPEGPSPMVRAWNAGVVYTVFQVATNNGRAVVALDFQSSIPGSPRRISEDVALPFAMGNGTVVLQEYAANSSSSNIFKLWNLSRNHLTGAPADDPVSPATANANTWGLYFRSIPPPVGHYAWDPFSGASTLRIDGGPYVTVWEDEWVYFRSGAGVYRFSPSR